MPAVMIKVRAATASGKFRHGPLVLTDRWSEVDLARPDVRRALVDHVGTRVRVHPNDVGQLAAAGLDLFGDQLLERAAPPPAPPVAEPPAALPATSNASAPAVHTADPKQRRRATA